MYITGAVSPHQFDAVNVMCAVGMKVYPDAMLQSPDFYGLNHMTYGECKSLVKRCQDPVSTIRVLKSRDAVYLYVYGTRDMHIKEYLNLYKFERGSMVDPLAWDDDVNRSAEEFLAAIINSVMDRNESV